MLESVSGGTNVTSPGINAIREIAVNATISTDCGMAAVFAEHLGSLNLIEAIGVPEALLLTLGGMIWPFFDSDSGTMQHTVFNIKGELEDLALA